MQASDEEVITRELKVVLKSAARMLYIAGLGNLEICTLVKEATYEVFEELVTNAPTTKDQGGN